MQQWDATAAGARGTPVRLSWIQPFGLVQLSVVNFVLRILTLGIYHFWGKTEVRKRIWSAIRFQGEPLAYTGTGGELFIGFLIVFGVVLLPVLLVSFLAALALGPTSPALALFQLVIYLVFFLLIGVATYRAQRYRLARTLWRGIRASLVGSSWAYGWTFFWTGCLVPLTFGWILPWRATRLQRLLTNDMRFGDRAFRFTGGALPLYKRFAPFWIGMLLVGWGATVAAAAALAGHMQIGPGGKLVPTRGAIALLAGLGMAVYLLYMILSAWYRAGMINHFAASTTFEGARFKGSVTAAGLIWITVTNFLITVLSLTLLSPVAQARWARYLTEHLSVEGTVPLEDISQSADQGISRGEGLAQAFDVDAF